MNRNQLSVLIRVDGDSQLGLGHMVRCRNLLTSLGKLTGLHLHVISATPKHATTIFSPISPHHIQFHELVDVFDLAIVDVPSLSLQEQLSIRNHANIVVCIDDNGKGVIGQDILICPNVLNLSPPSGINPEKCLFGPEYIILDSSFDKKNSNKLHKTDQPPTIVICFGGGDHACLTNRIARLMKSINADFIAEIILGSAFPAYEKTQAILNNDTRFTIIIDTKMMAYHLEKADFSIISGGTLLYESCATGTPSIVICQNQDQSNEAEIIQINQGCINLGLHSQLSDEMILSNIIKMMSQNIVRIRLGRTASKLIPQNGALRISEKILKICGQQ